MTTSVNDQYVTNVRLPRGCADALLSLVDGMSSAKTIGPSEYASLRQRLDDAIWLSRWLREEVCLELRSDEKIALLEAVLAALSAATLVEETHWLEELSGQLSSPGDAWNATDAPSRRRCAMPRAVGER